MSTDSEIGLQLPAAYQVDPGAGPPAIVADDALLKDVVEEMTRKRLGMGPQRVPAGAD